MFQSKTILQMCLTFFVSIFLSTNLYAKRLISGKIPQNKSNINLSAIRSEYNFEIRTAPVAIWAKWYTIDLSYRFGDQLALGPSVIFYSASEEASNMLAPSYNGYATGLNFMYYFDQASISTWYISGHLYYEKYKSYPHPLNGYQKVNGGKLNSAVGYQANWSQINLLTGLGLEYRKHQVEENLNYSNQQAAYDEDSVLPFLEIKIGFQF